LIGLTNIFSFRNICVIFIIFFVGIFKFDYRRVFGKHFLNIIFLLFEFKIIKIYTKINIIFYKLSIIIYIKLGIGDWGLGIGDWGFGPKPQTPKPKTQNPNPQ
jgi:hypothetical protein